MTSILASFLSELTNANWVDIASITILAICVIWDAVRGISATIASIAALIASFKLAFTVCSWVQLSLAKNAGGSTVSAFLPIATTIVLLIIIFIILRFLLTKFIQVIVQRPVDNLLGALAGLIKGMLTIFLVFAITKVALGGNYSSSAFSKSRTGRQLYPALEKVISNSYNIGTSKQEK